MAEGDVVLCFLHPERYCGADCIAFRTIPDTNVQLDSSQQHCIALSSLERAGRSLNIIGGLLSELNKRQRRAEEDAIRGNQPAPRNPMGGKS